jgi:CO/xanthine dehydrogenase Mo-binding subunit
MEKRGPVCTSATYIVGRQKVTGSCRFTFDLKLPELFVGKELYPEILHARITKLDTSAAEAIPGARASIEEREKQRSHSSEHPKIESVVSGICQIMVQYG